MIDYSKPDELPDGWYCVKGRALDDDRDKQERYDMMFRDSGRWYMAGAPWGQHADFGRVIAGPLDLPNLARDIAMVDALIDALDGALVQFGERNEDGPWKGYWGTMCLSALRDIGDILVKCGRWERHPQGIGRNWHYRPIAAKEKP